MAYASLSLRLGHSPAATECLDLRRCHRAVYGRTWGDDGHQAIGFEIHSCAMTYCRDDEPVSGSGIPSTQLQLQLLALPDCTVSDSEVGAFLSAGGTWNLFESQLDPVRPPGPQARARTMIHDVAPAVTQRRSRLALQSSTP